MPVAATHNNEERYISSLQSFVRRKCIEYFSNDNIDDDDESSLDTTNTNTNEGRVGLRCTFCNTLAPHLRSAKSCVYPRQTASIAAAILTIQYSHLPYCTEVPEEVMEHMEVLRENDLIKETRAAYNVNNKRKTKKRYRYGDVANEMGFRDIKDDEGEGEGGSNTKKGIIFIPPEESYGRKRQAVVYNDDSLMYGGGGGEEYSDYGGSSVRSYSRSPPPPPAPPQEDWTEDHDVRLWNGQEQLGNKWKDMSEIVFHGKWRSDQVRNRWYSQPFKDFVAAKYGKGAYKNAQALGKQTHNSGGRPSSSPSGEDGGGGGGYRRRGPKPSTPNLGWTDEQDMDLWNAQQELGNRWKDITTKLGRSSNTDHVKSRWYSDKFKEFVATNFGKGAYRAAHVAGKQERSGARPQVEWSEEDDTLLWTARQELGNKWEDISSIKFEGRMTENHVKNRWYSAAFKKFVATEYGPNAYQSAKIGRRGATSQVDWTPEDDMLLWTCHQEMGNKWGEMAELKFKERGINENQVKNRWYSAPFKKFVAEEFGPEAHKNAKHRRD